MNRAVEIETGRHHLPHWDQKETICFATFRLADSLPGDKLAELQEEKELFEQQHPKPWSDETTAEYYEAFGMKIDAWLDNGIGSCVLQNVRARRIVVDAFFHFDGDRYDLFAFVVMPNHVHVLFRPIFGNSVSEILHSWKSFTSKAISKEMGLAGTLWQKESFDRCIRNQAHFIKTVDYIKHNLDALGGAASRRATLWIGGVASCRATMESESKNE